MAIFLLLDYNKMVQFIYQQAQVNIIITTVYIFFKQKDKMKMPVGRQWRNVIEGNLNEDDG